MKTFTCIIAVLLFTLVSFQQAYAQLIVDAGNNDTICSNDAVQLGASASGGILPYSYLWSPAASISNPNIPNPVVSPSVTTTYIMQVTDALGGIAIDSVTINVNPSPSNITFNITNPSCYGISNGEVCAIVSGGTPNYTFFWSNVSTSQCNSNISAGTYTITATDANGCSISSSVVVTQPSPIVVSLLSSSDGIYPDTVCISSVSGGVPAYTYSYGGNFNPLPNNCFELLSGTFDVTVTDANVCAATTSSSCVGLQVTYTKVDVLCNGNATGSIDLTVTGGTQPYYYLWSNGAMTQDLINLFAGSYNVTVSDSIGCAATETVTINETTAIQSNLSVSDATCGQCNGEALASVSGGAGPYIFQYFDVPPVTEKCNATFCDALCGGNQYVLVITDVTGCIDSTFFTVGQQTTLQVDSLPNNNTACNTANNGVICASISGGQQPYVYQWSNQQTTQCIDSLSAGFYTVTVTDANNCTVTGTSSIAAQSTFQIDSIVTADVSCNDGSDGSACAYLSGGTPPYSYNWWPGFIDTTQCIYNLSAGNYFITVTDANGCTTTAATTVNEPAPLTAQITASNGGLPETLTITASGGTPGYTYLWSTGEISQSIYLNCPYTVVGMVIDANNCSVSDTLEIQDTCLISCVWPGDADNNGIADNNDLLPIGLAYGATGDSRCNTSIVWKGNYSTDWADTLSSGVNYKHIDCDGDSIINSNDTLAIIQNFGQIHLKNNQRKPWRANETALYVDLTPDTTFAGDTMYANLTLGDINIPAANVYGLAFTVNYNALVVDSTKTTVTFGNSWLGTATDKISIAKDLSANGELKCAITRIDHATRSGFGQIGQVSFIITTDNINGKDLIDYYTMEVWISDLVMIDSTGTIIPANEGADSTQVEFEPSSVRNQSVSIGTLTIQPNPANNEVSLSFSNNLMLSEMKLFDIEGRIILIKTINTITEKLNTSAFANGMYFVQVKNEKGVLTQRLAIAR